jgi:hypothetical protein
MATTARPLFHSIPDVGRQLGNVGRSKVDELINEYDIEITKVGRRSVVADSELVRLAEELRRRSQPPLGGQGTQSSSERPPFESRSLKEERRATIAVEK